jgi:putative selenate reductase
MSDRMRVIPFDRLINWIFAEYRQEKAIFSIPVKNFFQESPEKSLTFCGEKLSSPLGPAAGPHTQLAQNLAAAYLTGGRFFELKTVQVLDRLSFPKPCINAEDECYNTEWSTELSIEEAFAEYVKGWFLLHVLSRELFELDHRSFIFNMSVGYDLEGIKSAKVDHFIEGLKDASSTAVFAECKAVLKDELGRFKSIDESYIDNISPAICHSTALSTMHGCPHAEIEAICKYLMFEKQLHTYVKLNPTLLGYQYVRDTLDNMGYSYIRLLEKSFADDLSYDVAVPMLEGLMALAGAARREFGVKLSNTLPVKITRGELVGEQMYMSGKPLYALTINLAYKLAAEFDGKLKISYSGGADRNNIAKIIETGIQPVTVATTLLKPGGYSRLKQLAEIIAPVLDRDFAVIDLSKLKKIAGESLTEPAYHKKTKSGGARRSPNRCLFLIVMPLARYVCQSVPTGPISGFRLKILKAAGSSMITRFFTWTACAMSAATVPTFCPYGGRPYRDKLTLFRNEEDFADSQNNGFLLIGEIPKAIVKIRMEGGIVELNVGGLEKAAGLGADPAALSMFSSVSKQHQYLL